MICGLKNHGLVAQLGERTVRIRKVEGSIPFESTKKKDTASPCLSFWFEEEKELEVLS